MRKSLTDDLKFGRRNKKGDWAPSAYLAIAPVFIFPPRPLAFLKWLPGYFLPWNLLFAASAVAYATFVLPDVEAMKPPLYRTVHSVHHHSVNPSPWSSLSMQPVGHLLHFSSSLIHAIIPSNPVLAIYQLHYAGFGAVVGHIGFDKIETSEEIAFDVHAYGHYLRHRYFEVNFGDGLVPLDKLFGIWHDGSPEAEARMNARYEKRKARTNAVGAAG